MIYKPSSRYSNRCDGALAGRALDTIERMSRPPHARESVLDAFEAILIDEGERAATMDATARAAGVSKGGLLYHFASKDALESGVHRAARRPRRPTTSRR